MKSRARAARVCVSICNDSRMLGAERSAAVGLAADVSALIISAFPPQARLTRLPDPSRSSPDVAKPHDRPHGPCFASRPRWPRARKATIALVPTMGALHDGHVSLVRLAKRRAAKVIVSIFVNPTQFAPTEDFGSYPRTWKADIAKLAAEDVDLVWQPDVKTMYPEGFATRIVTEGPAAAGLEDRFRPHFFGGVATVVGKLFTQCRPDFAIFGEKDFQQLRVVTRMARDLDLGVRVIGSRTVRERDGLAMSSRNVYLVARGAPRGAGTVPRHEGERRAPARRRRCRRRDGRRRRNSSRPPASPWIISRSATPKRWRRSRCGQGRADADTGARPEIGKTAADRQHRGLNQSSPRSRSSRRNGSGIAATLAPADLPRSGGTSSSVK